MKSTIKTQILFSSVFLLCFFYFSAYCQTDSAIFNFKPGEQTWIVPQGINTVHIDAYGAQGGSVAGGKGGRVQSDLVVTPGAKLSIYVGSQPTSSEAGYNGGGKGCGNGFGGGGATDIRIGGTGLDNRVLVAGGGGGAGYSGKGGDGGGLIGGEGNYNGASDNNYNIAKGGTQEAGGAGARAYFAPAGAAGVGGDGINSTGQCTNNAMGGGGGGYFGGGGSGAGNGGGGSSYTNNSNHKVLHTQGVQEGNGKLVIYWERKK